MLLIKFNRSIECISEMVVDSTFLFALKINGQLPNKMRLYKTNKPIYALICASSIRIYLYFSFKMNTLR